SDAEDFTRPVSPSRTSWLSRDQPLRLPGRPALLHRSLGLEGALLVGSYRWPECEVTGTLDTDSNKLLLHPAGLRLLLDVVAADRLAFRPDADRFSPFDRTLVRVQAGARCLPPYDLESAAVHSLFGDELDGDRLATLPQPPVWR